MPVDYTPITNAIRETTDPEPIEGILGYNPTGDSMEVRYAPDTSVYYVRFNGSWGLVRHRGRVLPSPNIVVDLEVEHDGIMAIKCVNIEKTKAFMGAQNIGRTENGAQVRNRFIGGDPVDLRMVDQLGMRVVTGLEVKFKRGLYSNAGVSFAWDDEAQTIDLTSLLPGTDFYHRWAVVGFKTDVDPHEVYAAAGTEVLVTVSDLTLEMLSTVVNDEFLEFGYIPAVGVQLRYGQTRLTERDFEAVAGVLFGGVTQGVGEGDDTLLWLNGGY